jgi:preprotein translocase subunit YajC
MNWTILIIVGILAFGLVVFTIIRNQKDKKDYEEKMNNDYPKPKDKKGEIEDDGM